MEAAQVQRLREEQERALIDTDERIQQMKKFRDDYVAIQKRLKTLPDKATHDVMVPFGKLAFMPGHLYHTNEVLVLLGDNWFAERSAKQASEIAQRRIQNVDEQINALYEQRRLLEPRAQFTSELKDMAQDTGDVFEIKEDYDPVKENKWKENRKKKPSVKQESQEAKRQAQQAQAKRTLDKIRLSGRRGQGGDGDTSLDDQALWERLDQLERQEAQKGEMYAYNNNSEEEKSATKSQITNLPSETARSKKTVRWKDSKSEQEDEWCTDSEDEDDDGEEWEEEEEEWEEEEEDGEDSDDDNEDVKRPAVIHFKHSSEDCTSVTSGRSDDCNIVSPVDAYKQFIEPVLNKPRSILKNAGEVPLVASGGQQVEEQLFAASVNEPAFTPTVRERLNPQKMVSTLIASLDNAPAKPRKKPSKFKQRQVKTKAGEVGGEDQGTEGRDVVEKGGGDGGRAGDWEDDQTEQAIPAKPLSKFKQRRLQQKKS